VAVVGSLAAFNAAQAANVKAAFDDLYDGAGPLTADPVFVRDALASGDVFRRWDSTTNTIYDLTSSAYGDKGSSGNLFGGAEGTDEVPVELSEFVVN